MARKTGLKGLQEWAKHVTQGYSNVEITNMTTSFRNGLAFCAIIHRYRPDLIPYNSLRKEDVLKNNQLAFTVAENELDIPALLDAEDMVALSVPDKLSVATYLVQYYNYFKDKAPSSQVPGPKVTTPPSKPLGETPPAAKRTKVETIGPASVQVKATPPPSPKMAAMDKKSVSSPLLGQKTTPTHTTKPHPSPIEEKGSSKEPTPEPLDQGYRVKKGRKSKFRSPTPSDGLTVTPAAPTRNSAKRGSMGSENCDACGERVFLMERLAVEGHIFHRPCFKCFTCKCLLKPGSYEFDSKGAVFYCQAHYREAIRQSTLKRTMQQRGLLNGDEATKEVTEAKRKKEDLQHPSSPAKVTQSPASPTREITREESQKIKAGLPSLLKSLAGNKHEGKESEGAPTSPKHETDKVKGETKTANRIVVQSTAAPAKPQPPKPANQSPKADSAAAVAGKGSSEPPRRPTWSPKVQPRELTKKTPELPKVAANESTKMATAGQPRRPTWSPKIQPREMHNVTKTTPAESAKVAATGGASPSEPPRRPTWSPKIQPREIPKGQPESPKVSTKVGGEAPRRPTWSPKVQPAEGTKSKGELPKTTLAWLVKGKEVETVKGQSSPKPLRHATISGIPAKPSPPVTIAAVPAKPHPPVTIAQKQNLKKVIMTDGIPEEPTTTKEAPPTGTDTPAGPIKPPRKKKTVSKPHPPVVESEAGEQIMAEGGGKRESMIPKRPAPPRPNRPPSIKRPPLNQSEIYAVNEQRHKKRLGELRRQLRSLEQEQVKLEAKGIELERKLRTKDIDVDDHLMEEWFSLVNKKNMMVRQESDLVYELRDLELIEQHDQLEKEIRKRVTKDDSLKSELEKLEEEAMINELIELVEKRDQLLWALHLEKGRDEEEDKQVELIASSLHKATS